MTRRSFLPALGASAAAATAVTPPKERKLKQSVTAGVFRGSQMTLDDMCREAAKLGVYGFDLVKPEDWPTLKKNGLTPTMLPGPYGGTIPDGINRKENHDRLEKSLHEGIDLAAAAGCPNVITLSGNRRGMPDEEGADNCVLLLN
jgi:hydroxypyruvate isomerase